MLTFPRDKPIVLRDAPALQRYLQCCDAYWGGDYRINVVLTSHFSVRITSEQWFCNKLYVRFNQPPKLAKLELPGGPWINGRLQPALYDVVPGHLFIHIPNLPNQNWTNNKATRPPTFYINKWVEDSDAVDAEAELSIARDAIFAGDLTRAATIGFNVIPYGYPLFLALVQREAVVLRGATR